MSQRQQPERVCKRVGTAVEGVMSAAEREGEAKGVAQPATTMPVADMLQQLLLQQQQFQQQMTEQQERQLGAMEEVRSAVTGQVDRLER